MNSSVDFGNLPLPADRQKAQEAQKTFQNEVFVPQKLVDAVFGNSPYLAKLASNERAFFIMICEIGFDAAFSKLMADMAAVDIKTTSKKSLMSTLRVAKARASLLIALADISGAWNLVRITNSLSDFADLSIKRAVEFLFYEKFQQKLIASAEVDKSGYIMLAVGKLGGRELNYSSDVDLIALYDQSRINYTGKLSPKEFFIRLTQELVEILQQRTAEGYIFRADLRLRPDPYSTPVAVSTEAAEVYYENVGQNWERAAMIKARFVAGDETAANKYLEFLGTYIWRKNLDFKAVADIHSIKRQIDSSIDYKPENLFDYNIKLGKGGIREIEFFVQTQQLIWGGREDTLRCNTTCEGLQVLASLKHISQQTTDDLIRIYEFYRKIEHRLQMVADEHTHSLPSTPEGFKNFVIFLGYKNEAEFTNELTTSLTLVQKYYAQLFGESPSLGTGGGNLVFTGVSSDPETLLSLSKLGFNDPEKISEIIRGWHHGRRPSTRFRRVREILTELIPHILKSFGSSNNPVEAFVKFDNFLEQIPSGVQIFQLFDEKPELIDILAEIMGNSPWLAENLSRAPALVSSILVTDYTEPLPNAEELQQALDKAISHSTEYNEKTRIIRRWKHDMEFQVGIRLLRNIINHDSAAVTLSHIAEIVINKTLAVILEAEPEKIDGKLAIIAMGKLGSRELTFGSDLDLVFVYDSAAPEAASYYSKLVTKFTTFMSTLSADGMVYNIDTRLRPMGEKGALATSVTTYKKYYDESAWNWEFMALTKARVIAGEAKLSKDLASFISSTLKRDIDPVALKTDMGKMRERIAESFSPKNIWDIKYARGGLFELDFILQYLILANANKFPELAEANLSGANLQNLLKKGKIISAKQADELLEAELMLKNVQSAIRLFSQQGFDEATATDNQKRLMTFSLRESNFDKAKENLVQTENKVHAYYKEIFQS